MLPIFSATFSMFPMYRERFEGSINPSLGIISQCTISYIEAFSQLKWRFCGDFLTVSCRNERFTVDPFKISVFLLKRVQISIGLPKIPFFGENQCTPDFSFFIRSIFLGGEIE